MSGNGHKASLRLGGGGRHVPGAARFGGHQRHSRRARPAVGARIWLGPRRDFAGALDQPVAVRALRTVRGRADDALWCPTRHARGTFDARRGGRTERADDERLAARRSLGRPGRRRLGVDGARAGGDRRHPLVRQAAWSDHRHLCRQHGHRPVDLPPRTGGDRRSRRLADRRRAGCRGGAVRRRARGVLDARRSATEGPPTLRR